LWFVVCGLWFFGGYNLIKSSSEMSIYLIRHTTPLIDKGICYGQSDIDVTESFDAEAAIIKDVIPATIEAVYTSPLRRCRTLADYLFPATVITNEHDLKEIHCGEWELQHWDHIPRAVIDPWMNDFVHVCIPGGESYVQLHERVVNCFSRIAASGRPSAIVAHGGVIRSILAHITGTALADSFGAFKIHYGCVYHVIGAEGQWWYDILSNIASEKEQHKPSAY
jgi:alpha-ribazole phosphatase